MTYQIIYSPESLDDLRDIYSYIAFEKLAPENAEGQVNQIRKAIRSLDFFPEGHTSQALVHLSLSYNHPASDSLLIGNVK